MFWWPSPPMNFKIRNYWCSICKRHKFSERCFENLISMPIKSSMFIICTSRLIKMYREAHFYSVCFGAGGKSVTSLHRMGYFMGYLYLAWIRMWPASKGECCDQVTRNVSKYVLFDCDRRQIVWWTQQVRAGEGSVCSKGWGSRGEGYWGSQ